MHSKPTTSASGELKSKPACSALLKLPIVVCNTVSGRTLSVRQSYLAGVLSTLFAGSFARTSSVNEASSSVVAMLLPLVHGEKPAPFKLHSKMTFDSFELKVKVTDSRLFTGSGSVPVNSVSGSRRSTVHE
ncbi:hypothetical protein MYXA107069_09680 [Myxococcus xanthus]